MGEYTSWVQLTITALLFGAVIAATKTGLKKAIDSIERYVDKEISKMDNDLKSDTARANARIDVAHTRIDEANAERKREYLLESRHALICKNNSHELKEHFTVSLNAVFEAIRALEKKIDKLDGRTGFLVDKAVQD